MLASKYNGSSVCIFQPFGNHESSCSSSLQTDACYCNAHVYLCVKGPAKAGSSFRHHDSALAVIVACMIGKLCQQ